MRGRLRWFAAVFAAAWLAGVVAGAAERVRLATFNVLNYLEMDRRVEGRFRPAYPKPEVEKAAVRRAIHAVAPDVLALQEIGSVPHLEELRQDLAREGLDFPHGRLLPAADPERHVAVLSRLPFAEVVEHGELEFTYFGERELVKRGLLEVRFGEGPREWRVFVVHLKSRYTDRPDDPLSETRRVLEARAVRDRILEVCPRPEATPFLILGDFNDTTRSRTLAAFRARGRTPIATPLPATDSRGETWTHFFRGEDVYSRVDYILASAAALPGIIGGRATIHEWTGASEGSDHRMVHADYTPVEATPE